jgi:hypothetical protein
MKSFLIRYQFRNGPAEAWHEHVAAFIAALDSDPDLKGRIAYRCIKERQGTGYCHLATAVDDSAIAALQSKDFFRRYTEETKRVAGGEVEVVPIEVIAETVFRA